MPPLAVLSELRVADPGGVTIVEFEDQVIRNVVVVSACGAGTFEICKTQFDVVSCRLTPIVCGPPPGPTNRPDTITYSTAARTTVIATMRMVAMTGDTASSSFRMMRFMVLASCCFCLHGVQREDDAVIRDPDNLPRGESQPLRGRDIVVRRLFSLACPAHWR